MSTPPVHGPAATVGAESSPAFTNPRKGFLFFLALAAVGAGMAYLVPLVLTLSIKVAAIAPDDPTTALSIASGITAIASLIAFPSLGRLSDRTLGGWGRRRPYLVMGGVLLVIGAIVMLLATSLPVLLLGAAATGVGYSSIAVAMTATIPDLFSPDRRGPASAIVGLSLPVGALVGLFIAQLVSPNLALMIMLPACIGLVGAVAFSIALPDRQLDRSERPPFSVGAFFGTFWVNPVRYPNFALAWFSRLLLFIGVAAVQAYQVFYLIQVLKLDAASVAGAVFVSTLVLTGFALVFAPLAGKLSDRLGRRKPFVIASSIVFAIGLVLASFATTFPVFLIAMAVIGLGQGVYFAVDIALVTQILPDRSNPGKDLGIMNLASSLPIVQIIAPAVLAIGASAVMPQNFPALFISGAIASLIGALLIIPIRGVR
jgi:MFS family permease